MKNRGCFFLLPLLALAGNANAVLAQRSALQVQVYDYAGLSPAALDQFIARTQAILAGSGVSLEVDACKRGALLCESHTGSSRQIVIRVISDTGKTRTKDVRLDTLGQSIAGPDGGTYATLFLKPVGDTASEESLPRTIVLAYAAAHEIGHLLLGEAHTAEGLMKAYWNADDFLAMAQNRFHFSPAATRELATRYGTARRGEGGADTDLAIRN